MHMAFDLKTIRVLKIVALFETFKGLLGLFAGAGMLFIARQNIQLTVWQLVKNLHLDPEQGFSKIIIEASGNLTANRIRFLFHFCPAVCTHEVC